MPDPQPTVVTETYDLDMNLVGIYCSYNIGDDQVEHACLLEPGLVELGAYPPGLAPVFAPEPYLPPVAFIVKHDFDAVAPTWGEFADWAVALLVANTPNSAEQILAHALWATGWWQAKDRWADAPELIAAERKLDGHALNRAGNLRRLRWGGPIAGAYFEAPTQVALPYKRRMYQMKGEANTQPDTGVVYYGNDWKPMTLADFLGSGSPQSWKYLQVADWTVQREFPGTPIG